MKNHTQDRKPSLILEFQDNSLIPALFGENDKNLEHLEEVLDLTFSSRGNKLAIYGRNSEVQKGATILKHLYERLQQGHGVNFADVGAQIKMEQHSKKEQKIFSQQTIKTPNKQIIPRSLAQSRYIEALGQYNLIFGEGPAGTGKTYLAVAMAVAMLNVGKVDRIICSRPAVEAGEQLGFLPGDMREKVDPYMRPIYDALYDTLGYEQVERKIENNIIEIAPLAFMRGRTLSHAFVLLDEAQNTTPAQIKMFMTRLGEGSIMAINGDLTQVDLPPSQASGLGVALDVLLGVEGIAVRHFDQTDVVRHPLVARIVDAYGKQEQPLKREQSSKRKQPH